MLRGCLGLLILLPALARAEVREDLVRIWDCRFDNGEASAKQWDINYDDWPDRWTRVYDDEHPRYARIAIADSDDPSVMGRRLSIDPDGASATAASPPIHVNPRFSYKLRFRARLTEGAAGDARVRLAFYAGDELRQVERTKPISADGAWHEMELGDFQPRDKRVDRVYVEIDYQRGELGDLGVDFSVADFQLYRLPSIRIYTDSEYNVYTSKDDVLITCSLSGISKRNPEVRFQLFDATDQSIGSRGQMWIDGKIINVSRTRASEIVDGFDTDRDSYEGSIEWRPPIDDYGFFRIRVGLYNPETDQPIGEARAISIAVVPEGLISSEQGEFGWSLPRADDPLSFEVLRELLPRAGVRMVKLPVWYAPGDERRAEDLIHFAEQLAARNVEMIGVIEDPSPRIADPYSKAPTPDIENLLSTDQSYWTPLIDHVITRLSLRIRWWQLGHDHDTSFVGYDNVLQKIRAIRNQMFRFGQDVRVGLGWRWDHVNQWNEPLSWDFLQMTERSRLDAQGLEQALSKTPPSASQRWVLVEPPEVPLEIPAGVDPNDQEDPQVRKALVRRHQIRVRDFIEQILVAKVHGAEGIFVADPFSGEPNSSSGKIGVMNQDGTPGELLLPWRTCARLLGGAKYVGSIQLPHGSSNWLFKRPDGQMVMVLWNLSAETVEANSTPIEEVLYLGEDVQIIDIWGDRSRPEMRGHRQVVPVGRMPRFVQGLNEAVARWRLAMRFDSIETPSVFGVPHPNRLLLRNHFPQGIGGKLSVFVPAREAEDPPLSEEQSTEWDFAILSERFRSASSERITIPLEVVLNGASYGKQLVRVDFDVEADREYQFSVWRDLRVGLDDLHLEVQQFLRPDGRLLIEQHMQSQSNQPTDFKCQLYVKGRRRQRSQVYQLGPDNDIQRYTYRNPEDLLGLEMRLQVEEVYGQRVLIYRFRIDPKPYDPEQEQTEGEQKPNDLAWSTGG